MPAVAVGAGRDGPAHRYAIHHRIASITSRTCRFTQPIPGEQKRGKLRWRRGSHVLGAGAAGGHALRGGGGFYGSAEGHAKCSECADRHSSDSLRLQKGVAKAKADKSVVDQLRTRDIPSRTRYHSPTHLYPSFY